MSTAIRIPGDIILGGHKNCPPGDRWYAGEKSYLANLKAKYFDVAQRKLNQAEALVSKIAPNARGQAQSILQNAEAKIEQRAEVIKDTEEELYEEFMTGCAYTNSGNPISLHIRATADVEAKNIANIASKAYANISGLYKRNASSPATKSGPVKIAGKAAPSKSRAAAPSAAARACAARINGLLSRGAITRVSIPGGNVMAHCMKTTGGSGLGEGVMTKLTSKKGVCILLMGISAYFLWSRLQA